MEYCLSPLGACLRAAGEDAAAYLQGQITQNLTGLAPGGAIYGLILNHKGRIQADVFIIGGDPEVYWICSYYVGAARLREQLEAFIVADDVVLEDVTPDFTAVTVFGEGAPAAVAALAAPGDLVFPGRRGVGPQVDWLIRSRDPAEAAAQLRARHGAAEIESGERERRRIAAGIPAVPADAGPGELPQEAGLEAALSYSKGCYIGQEIMARLQTRGRVRRRLRRVEGAGPAPTPGTALYGDGKASATMRTSAPAGARFIGWALVAGEQPAAGGAWSLSPGGPAEIRLTDA